MLKNLNNCLLLFVVLLLSACSSFVPKEHLIPKAKLVSSLEKKFPMRHEGAGGLVTVVIHSPHVTLMPEQNRLSIKGLYTANATPLEIKGNFVFSSKLTYNKGKRAIFLSDARFDSFEPSGGFLEQQLRSALNQQVEEFVSDSPVYTFKPDELVILGVKVDVEAIHVVNNGILLKLLRQ